MIVSVRSESPKQKAPPADGQSQYPVDGSLLIVNSQVSYLL